MAPRWPNDPMPSGVPYADLPITNSNCMNKSCIAFAAGFNESEETISLISQIDYGFWVLSYYGFWLILFTLFHLGHVLGAYLSKRRSRSEDSTGKTTLWNKLVARYRSLASRRFSGRRLGKLGLPSFGVLALLSLSTIFIACLIFPQQPYLRSRFRFGSPPLSVRCALCLSALMPLLIALGGKVNIITMLTGVCYTKLNIFHRYVGGLIFTLATIHMVPHVVAPVKDGGLDYLAQLYINHKRELSGTILYFVFLCLVLLSLPWVRRRFYEFFVFCHIFLAMGFVGILWWHIDGEYISPNYTYATVGVWALSSLLRTFDRNQSLRHGNAGGFPTTLESLPGQMTKVTIDVPKGLKWKPGHHSFIRMPQMSLFDNHPFTIASVPSPADSYEPNQLVFLVRAHAGFTRRLAQCVEKSRRTPPPSSPSMSSSASSQVGLFGAEEEKRAWSIEDMEAQRLTRPRLHTLVDGPYGGYTGPLHRKFDSVVLVAGGTGITSALPWALELSGRMRDASSTLTAKTCTCGAAAASTRTPAMRSAARPVCVTTDVRLVWIVRSADWLDWVRNEFDAALRAARQASSGRLVIDVYVTGERRRSESEESGSGSGSESDAESRPESESGLVAAAARPSSACGSARSRSTMSSIPDSDLHLSSWFRNPSVETFQTCALADSLELPRVKGGAGSALNVRYERPNIPLLVPQLVTGHRSIVLGCGPDGLKNDLSNATARLQSRVLEGHMAEVALHTESFGW